MCFSLALSVTECDGLLSFIYNTRRGSIPGPLGARRRLLHGIQREFCGIWLILTCKSEVGSSGAMGDVKGSAVAAEDGDYHSMQHKVKFLCSFGGSILPRPSDGKLRYAGGDTRIVSVARDVNYRELMWKLQEIYDREEPLTLKYQEPQDDLDSLVSVLCDDDVYHMMEEYDILDAGEGVLSKIRLFLFAAGEDEDHHWQHNEFPSKFSSIDGNDPRDPEQRYVDALNSVVEIIRQSDNNSNINNNSGNCSLSEAGVAQHVSVALPVSSMKPFVKVGGSASSSPPSSPSQYHRQSPHLHDHSDKNPSGHHHHHHQYVHSSNLVQHGETPGLEFPARGQVEVVSSHHQYVHNLSVSARESLISDVDGGQREPGIEFPVKGRALELDSQHHHQYLPNSNLSWHEPQGFELHPNSQGVELHPKVHSEQSGHHQSHHQQFVPYAHESHGKIPMVSVVEFPSKRQSEVSRGEFPSKEKSELSNFHQQYVPYRHESYREIPTVSGVEFSSKGQSDVNKRDFPSKAHSEFGGFHQQSLSNRCEPCQEIPRMSGSEFSSKGQSEVGRGELPLKGQAEFGNVRYQYVSQGHESYLQVPMVSRTEFTSKVQSEIGRFEFPLKGRPDVSSLHQQQMPRQRDSYLEISPLSRVEFPDQEQQVDVSSHHSHVISNITPPLHESYHEIPVVPGFEFPLKGQSDIGSEIHSEILINRQYKEKVVDPFMTHVEARGNLQQFQQQHVNAQSGIVVGEVGNDNRRISNLSSHQFDMNSPVCLQPQQKPLVYHQAAGHSSSGVHHDQEHIYKDHHHELGSSNSRQKNTFLHPLGRQAEQHQHLQIDDELRQGLYSDHEHNSLYYATSPRYSHDFVSASQSGIVLEHMDSMPGARDVNPSSSQERYLENHHHHVQVPWAYDEYGNRVDYISSQLRGNLAPLNFHPNYTSYTPVDEHIMYHQQSPFTEEDARFQGQNLNHLPKRFEDRLYAGIQSKENLADAWILNSYQEQLPSYSEQYRSDQVNFWKHNESGEYYPSVSRELSIENLNAGMDHRMYAAEQTEQLASFRDDREKTRGLVLHQANHQVEKARMLADGEVNGVHVAGDSMQSDLGQNNIWDRYPRCYPGVHPGSIFHVTPPVDKGFSTELAVGNANFAAMHGGERLLQDVKALNLGNAPQRKLEHMRIETHSDNNSVVHLQSSDGQRLGFHRDAEGEDVNAVLGQRDGQNIERREHVYPYNKTNDAAEANSPNYWSNNALQKNTNAFYQDNQHVKDFDFTRETEDIKFPATESFKRNTGFLRGTDISCEPNAFTLLEDNEILSSGDFLHAITSSVALVPDGPTDGATSDNFSFASVSSPQRINVVTSTTVPIYDQTPPNSVDTVVRETLWAEPEEESKHNELENNAITGSDRVMPITEELSVECNSNGLELPRQDEGVDKTCLNGKMGEDINRTSRNTNLSLYGPNILSSSMNSKYEILDKKDSSGKVKEEVKQVAYKNDHVGTAVSISDLEENVAQQEVPENNLLGLDEDVHNHSVDMAKSASTEAKIQALDKGLQTIKNADLEEIRELGSGTYGTVYHGKWKGSDVAIKRIKASCFEGRPSERERLIADFWKEASILSQLHHPNVVSFYGVVQDGPNDTLATVTEFMVNGSLKQVLRKKDRTVDRRKRLILAMDAAFGMEYLHEKGVVHFDLKCENLLVNMRDPHRPVCKIGDMGLSKVKHQTLVSGGVRGTLPWMAPELLSGKSGMVTDKIDVYSFGIVMWELLTGDEPYADMHCGSIIGGIMNNTLRPSVPSWCDPAWRSLMERCWSADPEERPPFSEISKELRQVAASTNLK